MNKVFYFLKSFIIIGSLVGFGIQTLNVSMQYFSYATTIRVRQTRSKIVIPLTVCFCVPYAQMIKGKGKRSDNRYTVAEIMTLTPPIDRVIESCRYRDTYGRIKTRGGKRCHEKYKLTKFYTRESVCYMIDEKEPRKIIKELVTHARTEAFVVSVFFLNKDFEDVTRIQAFAYDTGLPYLSRDYATETQLTPDTWNNVEISPSFSMVTNIPLPYENGCLPNEEWLNRQLECPEKCNVQGLECFDRVPYNFLMVKHYNHPPIDEEDMYNESFSRIVDSVMNKCDKKCLFRILYCSYSFTFTRNSKDLKQGNKSISMTLLTPYTADTFSEAVASMSFVEFFSFVTSCFGFWFGISFLSIDLKKWYQTIDTRYKAFRRTKSNRCDGMASGVEKAGMTIAMTRSPNPRRESFFMTAKRVQLPTPPSKGYDSLHPFFRQSVMPSAMYPFY